MIDRRRLVQGAGRAAAMAAQPGAEAQRIGPGDTAKIVDNLGQ